MFLCCHRHYPDRNDGPKKMKKVKKKTLIFRKSLISRTRARDFFKRVLNMSIISHLNFGEVQDVLVMLGRFKKGTKWAPLWP